MAKKKKEQQDKELSAEDLAEIDALTGNLGPAISIPDDLQEELDEVIASGPDETDVLLAELDTVREEARNNQELYLRALAEMDNMRKRNQREKEDIAKFGNENILREILPVIDNLERAVEHASSQQEGTALLEGVQMTLVQFRSALQKFGVNPLASQGELFDPSHHQAMGQMETLEVPVNHIAQELQKGYLLNNRLLRPAMVMVAKAPQPPNESSETREPATDGSDTLG